MSFLVKGIRYPRLSLWGTISYRGFVNFMQDLLQDIWVSPDEGVNGLVDDDRSSYYIFSFIYSGKGLMNREWFLCNILMNIR